MTCLALHGFTQRGGMWEEVAAMAGGRWLLPDLPGHGDHPACGWDEAVAWLAGLLEGLEAPRCLAGYSMGGRLALATAVQHPELVDRLVVLSADAGMADAGERERRRAEDLALAERLEAVGTERFVDEWLAGPLFAGLTARPAEWRAADRALRLGNDASGLAAALRRLGRGSQPYLGDRLGRLGMPVLLVAGTADGAYASSAGRLARALPKGTATLVSGAGHAVVGERPAAVASLLTSWGMTG